MKILQYLKMMILSLFTATLPKVNVGVEHLEFWSKNSRKRAIEQGNLDSAIERASDLEHMEGDSFESWESDNSFDDSFDDSYEEAYEESLSEEGFSNSDNLTNAQRRRVANRMRRKKGSKGAIYGARRSGKLLGGLKNVDGQITLNIVRNSYNIPYDLPCQVFNSLDGFCNSPLVNKYIPNPDVQFLGGYVDATFTNFVFRFRRISTNVTDSITVSCNEVSYVKLLFGMMTDTFTVTGGTVQISDETQTVQFNKRFTFSSQNILGRSDDNPLNMGSFIKPDNFRKDVANILVSFPVNKQRGFIFTTAYINGAAPGYALTTTFFLNLGRIKIHK